MAVASATGHSSARVAPGRRPGGGKRREGDLREDVARSCVHPLLHVQNAPVPPPPTRQPPGKPLPPSSQIFRVPAPPLNDTHRGRKHDHQPPGVAAGSFAAQSTRACPVGLLEPLDTQASGAAQLAESARFLEGGVEAATRLFAGAELLESDVQASAISAWELLRGLVQELLPVPDSHYYAAWKQSQTSRASLLEELLDLLEVSLLCDSATQADIVRYAGDVIDSAATFNVYNPRSDKLVPDGTWRDVAVANFWYNDPKASILNTRTLQSTSSVLEQLSAQSESFSKETKFATATIQSAASVVLKLRHQQLSHKAGLNRTIVQRMKGQHRTLMWIFDAAQKRMMAHQLLWAFAIWRVQQEEHVASEWQIRKLDNSRHLQKEVRNLIFVCWAEYTTTQLMGRMEQELSLRQIDCRMVAIRTHDLQDKLDDTQSNVTLSDTARFMMEKKAKLYNQTVGALSHRLAEMPPDKMRKYLLMLMEVYVKLLVSHSKLDQFACRKALLSKEVYFLSSRDGKENPEVIVSLSCDELLLRWSNCLLLEAKHLVSSLMASEAGIADIGKPRGAIISARFRDIRQLPEITDLGTDLQDGKVLAVLYAMIKSSRMRPTSSSGAAAELNPQDIEALDERDAERRVAKTYKYLMGLAPTPAARSLLRENDILEGNAKALRLFLAAVYLSRAPGLDGIVDQDAEGEKFQLAPSKVAVEAYVNRERRKSSVGQIIAGTEKIMEREDLVFTSTGRQEHPMAIITRTLEAAAGNVAYQRTADPTRLLKAGEAVGVLESMALNEILIRWVNLQIEAGNPREQPSSESKEHKRHTHAVGEVLPNESDREFIYPVNNLGKALSNGRVLLRVLQQVAPEALEIAGVEPEEKPSPALVMPLIKRCLPSVYLPDDAWALAQEDVLAAVVAGLFLKYPNLKPLPKSGLATQISRASKVIEAGMGVIGKVKSRKSAGLPDASVLVDFLKAGSGQRGNELRVALDGLDTAHKTMADLNSRFHSLVAEIVNRRVMLRGQKFKASSLYADAGADSVSSQLQDIMGDEAWITFSKPEVPSTMATSVRDVVRGLLHKIADIVKFYSICIEDEKVQVHWSGIARMYRDCRLFCPCLFLPRQAAKRIFFEVLEMEPNAKKELPALGAAQALDKRGCSWQQMGLSPGGFLRWLLRVSIHREACAKAIGATELTLSRSLVEVMGHHFKRSKCELDEEDDFGRILQTKQVSWVQESWEPLLRAIFNANAQFGPDSSEEIREWEPVPRYMSEESFLSLMTQGELIGSSLTEAAVRSVVHNILLRGPDREHGTQLCFNGQAEVRRRARIKELKRELSPPASWKGRAAPCPRRLRTALTPQSRSLYFEDFQDCLLAVALYHNPNLVVPQHRTFSDMLSMLVANLSVSVLIPVIKQKLEIPSPTRRKSVQGASPRRKSVQGAAAAARRKSIGTAEEVLPELARPLTVKVVLNRDPAGVLAEALQESVHGDINTWKAQHRLEYRVSFKDQSEALEEERRLPGEAAPRQRSQSAPCVAATDERKKALLNKVRNKAVLAAGRNPEGTLDGLQLMAEKKKPASLMDVERVARKFGVAFSGLAAKRLSAGLKKNQVRPLLRQSSGTPKGHGGADEEVSASKKEEPEGADEEVSASKKEEPEEGPEEDSVAPLREASAPHEDPE